MTDFAFSAATPADAAAAYRREVAVLGAASVPVHNEMEHHFPRVGDARREWIRLFDRDHAAHVAAQPDDFDAMDIWSGGETFGPQHHAEDTRAAWRTYQAALAEAASALVTTSLNAQSTDLIEFRVTFGGQYAHEDHPQFPAAHPDGWLTVFASDEMIAQRTVIGAIGTGWCMIYHPSDPGYPVIEGYYKRGELGRVCMQCGSTGQCS